MEMANDEETAPPLTLNRRKFCRAKRKHDNSTLAGQNGDYHLYGYFLRYILLIYMIIKLKLSPQKPVKLRFQKNNHTQVLSLKSYYYSNCKTECKFT